MNKLIEKLAFKVGEGYQSSSLVNPTAQTNIYHRQVTTYQSTDLSFINGLIATGLRGSALVDGDFLINNYHQLHTAVRQHLPLVVNTSARLVGENKHATLNNYDNIKAIQTTGAFQLVATSPQEEIFLTLIAHRIAELSLIPGIVIADYPASDNKIDIPADNLIKDYLGNPDNHIESPTPAQEIIFGKTRRRIPNWYSLDIPVMLGVKKDSEAISFEAAASQKYFYQHLPQLIKQAFTEFNKVFGVEMQPISTSSNSSEHTIIALGGQIKEVYNQLPEESKAAGLITVNQLSPFPAEALKEALNSKKAISILENTSGNGSGKSTFYYNIISLVKDAQVYHGQFSSALTIGALQKAIQHMVTAQPKTDYYLGLEFTKPESSYPKHDILLKEISKQYPDLINESLNEQKTDSSSKTPQEVPLAIRLYQDKGPVYSRLSRFYDSTAFFYEQDEHGELVADPFAAVPLSPSASASFFNHTDARNTLPVLNTSKCTGCGDCFVQCPHSALPPIAIGIEQLMKAGMEIAAAKGAVLTKLTPLLKNLAKVTATTIKDSEINSVSDILPTAFSSLTGQMKLEGEKLAAAEDEFNLVLNEIAALPVAVTDTFYNNPSQYDAGSGELFSLAVNPAACTGCSICAQVCSEEAISMEVQETETLTKANDLFKLWEQLPDISGDTVNRLYHDENYSSLAAMMLSRSFYMTMSGASSSESDNPYKTLLNIVSATTESVIQPRTISLLKQIDELIGSLSDNIHGKLSTALPKENLEGLSKSLKRARGGKVSLSQLVNQLAENNQGKLIDANMLSRKTDLVDDLKDLKWALAEGPSGVGRSRYGMLLAGSTSMEWAKQYPANNFTSPSVIHWHGSAPEQSLGLFHGQLRYLVDNIKLIRRAELEAQDKYDPHIHDAEIAALTWNDLTEDEKRLVPPIILVGERDDLSEAGWSSLNKLLAEKYPVKVFLFDHIASPKTNPVANLIQTTSGLFSAIALKNAFVFQGGMGNTEHLFNGLIDGLAKTTPALFNLYATKLGHHGEGDIDWSPYAALALNSRSFPALRYDPEADSNFLNGAVDIAGNNDEKEAWLAEEITIAEDENINYKISWADWAFTQTEWKTEFRPVAEDAANVMVTEFIQLDPNNRKGKVPVIMRADSNGLKYYSVSDEVIEMTEATLSNWRTWQELAGLLTKYPEKLKQEVTKELQEQYDQETAALKQEYEQKVKENEAAYTEKIRQQIKNKLVELSAMANK